MKIHGIENKLTRFQVYSETEVTFKYIKPQFRQQYSETLAKYEKNVDIKTGPLTLNMADSNRNREDENSYIPVTISKINGNTGGKIRPENQKKTRLQELSLTNNINFRAMHYNIHLDLKLFYTLSRIFQEKSFCELETLHHLCELERTQILQSLASALRTTP